MAAKKNSQARKDPERRFHDVTAPYNRLKNRDPDRHYVYVHKACNELNPEYYESLGYEVELSREGGPKPTFGGASMLNGSTIEHRGHVLMSISKEAKAELDRVGPNGNTGYDLYDRLEAASSRDVPAGVRGTGHQMMVRVVRDDGEEPSE
jgi:hypothetical protein